MLLVRWQKKHIERRCPRHYSGLRGNATKSILHDQTTNLEVGYRCPVKDGAMYRKMGMENMIAAVPSKRL